MNCPRRSDGSCECGNLDGANPCDVDQDKVSAEYLVMAERFAMRHAHSRYFVDVTSGGAFSAAGLLPGAKIVKRGPYADVRRVLLGEAIGAVYRRDREGEVQLSKVA